MHETWSKQNEDIFMAELGLSCMDFYFSRVGTEFDPWEHVSFHGYKNRFVQFVDGNLKMRDVVLNVSPDRQDTATSFHSDLQKCGRPWDIYEGRAIQCIVKI